MRINGQSSMRIGQMILTGSNRTGVSKHNNALTKKCRDEYIQGVIQPSFTYSKNSARSSISRSVIDTINFGYMGIHKNHGESVNSIKVNGTEYLKKDIPAVNPKWCTQIKAKNNVMDASTMSQGVWERNDFPFEKFFEDDVDESVLNWKPMGQDPDMADSSVLSR